ncbi:unnamed protein product [Vitrella brassicaformis CCMP3155]|uniref:Methyltransferase domain-containing protein n=1 Tax=Vitrella brassicaformis (strain CCMP3155) TaxID=1169540 RepID=A0A0G4GN10_VITBC|nr:unnamed protein product [Vitrella brassicaformis CCMP3155]|eukprot:CEM31585.1 unnamed protein product [Vitrella brassicaformis CCMP3155]
MREDGLYDAFPSIPPSFIPSEPQVIVRVSVEGKVRTRRIHGKGRLTFLDVDIQHSRDAGKEEDGSGAEQGQDGQVIQVVLSRHGFVAEEGRPSFACWVSNLSPNTHALFIGQPMRTRTGQLSVEATHIRMIKVEPSFFAVDRLLADCRNGRFPRTWTAAALGIPASQLASLLPSAADGHEDHGNASARKQRVTRLARRLAGLPEVPIRPIKHDERDLALLEQLAPLRDKWPLEERTDIFSFDEGDTHGGLPCEVHPRVNLLRQLWRHNDSSDGGEGSGGAYGHQQTEEREENSSVGTADGQRERRLRYADEKKAPQVQWMVKRVQEWLRQHQSSAPRRPARLIDIGGGRGDLSLACAVAFPDVDVLMTEPHEPSRKAAMTGAQQLGVGNLSVYDMDLDAFAAHLKCLPCAPLTATLIIGLHACGGLSDGLIDLGLATGSSCLVCTCCFTAHQHLAARLCTHTEQLQTLARLAESPLREVSAKAMHTYNGLRLESMRARLSRERGRGAAVHQLRHLSFPACYSVKNMVIYMGVDMV